MSPSPTIGYTPEQMVTQYSPKLQGQQKQEQAQYFTDVVRTIRDGGHWGWPDRGLLFQVRDGRSWELTP